MITQEYIKAGEPAVIDLVTMSASIGNSKAIESSTNTIEHFTFQDKSQIIISVVLERYSQKWSDVKKSCRKREYIVPRQTIMYFLRKMFSQEEMSLKRIASMFESKNKGQHLDHSTVINSINRVEGYLGYDKQYRRDVEEMEHTIKICLGL